MQGGSRGVGEARQGRGRASPPVNSLGVTPRPRPRGPRAAFFLFSAISCNLQQMALGKFVSLLKGE